jgi:hypothetical protein
MRFWARHTRKNSKRLNEFIFEAILAIALAKRATNLAKTATSVAKQAIRIAELAISPNWSSLLAQVSATNAGVGDRR